MRGGHDVWIRRHTQQLADLVVEPNPSASWSFNRFEDKDAGRVGNRHGVNLVAAHMDCGTADSGVESAWVLLGVF